MHARGAIAPPPLPHLRAPLWTRPVVLIAVGAVLASFVAWAAGTWGMQLPGCGFKRLTGCPCPGCGGTRSLAALAHFEVGEALAWNPLVAAIAVLAIAAAGVFLLDHVLARGWLARRWDGGIRFSPALRWIALALVVANWIYLFRTLS